MNFPFAHNLFYFGSHFNKSIRNLWHLTLAYIFKLCTDIYTYCKRYYVVFWFEQSHVRDNL